MRDLYGSCISLTSSGRDINNYTVLYELNSKEGTSNDSVLKKIAIICLIIWHAPRAGIDEPNSAL